jgi:hypothetical protein
MGGATFLIGCIPSYENNRFCRTIIAFNITFTSRIPWWREYGGAAIMLPNMHHQVKRILTSWIQTTAPLVYLCSFNGNFITKDYSKKL